ncbi:MAG: glycosyltransferase [Desulfobacterales bacterium]|nr:glycosyltransferase [Desulfobacterales bacterium]
MFITNSSRIQNYFLDPAVRYRCYNTAYDLQQEGHTADVCHMKVLSTKLIENYDVFIFHRPSFNKKLRKICNIIKKKKKLLIADYDDLIFDEQQVLFDPLIINNKTSLSIARSMVRENHKALLLFENITVSTSPLKRKVIESNPFAKVKIIYNGLSHIWLKHAEIYRKNECKKVISYMSGTNSHDMDFKEFEEPLEQFLIESPEFNFESVGPVQVNFKSCNKQVRKKEGVDFFSLPDLIKNSWVTIAPLQKTIFNECKSSIKFLESAAFGVPVLCSPIPDMMRFKDSGLIICNSADQFYYGLKMLKDPYNYKLIAKKIKNFVWQNTLSVDQTHTFIKFVNKIKGMEV